MSNIKQTEDSLVEKSTGRKIESPLDETKGVNTTKKLIHEINRFFAPDLVIALKKGCLSITVGLKEMCIQLSLPTIIGCSSKASSQRSSGKHKHE